MINIKARLKNKTFWVGAIALLISFVYKLLTIFEVIPSVSENEVIEIIGILLNLLAFIGVINDPTTKGFADSSRVMTYYTDNDVRLREGIDIIV